MGGLQRSSMSYAHAKVGHCSPASGKATADACRQHRRPLVRLISAPRTVVDTAGSREARTGAGPEQPALRWGGDAVNTFESYLVCYV
jgi:hypothetical protein